MATAGGGKFQSYWLYAIMSLVMLALVISSLGGGTNTEIDKRRLLKMLEDDGAITKIELVNGKSAHIFIDEDRRGKGQYQDAGGTRLQPPGIPVQPRRYHAG